MGGSFSTPTPPPPAVASLHSTMQNHPAEFTREQLFGDKRILRNRTILIMTDALQAYGGARGIYSHPNMWVKRVQTTHVAIFGESCNLGSVLGWYGLSRGVGRKRAEYCFESTVSEERTH